MIIPTFKSITYSESKMIERALPSKGRVLVSLGDVIESYTKLGFTRHSMKEVLIPRSFKIFKKFLIKKQVLMGDVVASDGERLLLSPFDGSLEKRGVSYALVKNPEDYWLVSGISGEVKQVVPNRSVLIETSGFELKLVACSLPYSEGVLEVLPNPSELIEIEFMDKYIKNGIGKIVYTGNFLRPEMLIKSIETGCEGILCSSCDRQTLVEAKKNNFFVGVISGFGRIPISLQVMEFLKTFNSKYCLVREDSETLFISDKDLSFTNQPSFINLKVGLVVKVLDYPYFGWEGVVEKIENDQVYVRIIENSELVCTNYYNLVV